MHYYATSPFLAKSISIADRIIKAGCQDADGLFWKTKQFTYEKNGTDWVISENLYGGVAGINLFLQGLYESTKNEALLAIVKESARWLVNYCEKNPTSNYGFYSGRLGVSYVLARLSVVANDKQYLQYALRFAKNAVFNTERNDLLSGKSGYIISLLYLHSLSGDEWILDHINQCVKHLINGIEFGEKGGIYWERSQNNIKGLCGMAHGASGVALAFSELGSYFSNPTFYWLAKQAFLYENCYFNSETCNWPDFRKLFSNQELIEDLSSKPFAQVNERLNALNEITAWCHGAPGIGLARLRYQHLSGDTSFQKDLTSAIDCTINLLKQDSELFVLCHGNCGNAFFLHETNQYGMSKKCNGWPEAVASKALEYDRYFTDHGFDTDPESEDPGLFMGASGIGYYLLQVSKEYPEPSILAPTLAGLKSNCNIEAFEYLSLQQDQLLIKLVDNTFPKAMFQLKSSGISIDLNFEDGANIYHGLKDEVKQQIDLVRDVSQRSKVKDAFKFDTAKKEMILAIENFAAAFIREKNQINSLNALTKEINNNKQNHEWWDSLQLRMAENTFVAEAKWDWISSDDPDKKSKFHYLAKLSANQIIYLSINEFSYILLSIIRTQTTYKDILLELFKSLSFNSEGERDKATTLVKRQIEILLHIRLIVRA